ncbi:MAG: ribulokinase [Candidatus Omnitrophica bacterium]|nr:ribulokinase [Candidatus Omnitrophota bacterium]
MSDKGYVIGIDYGTDSVRSVIVDAADGQQISGAVHNYTRWEQGQYCDAVKNQFRQHPLDYIEGLEITVKQVLSNAPEGTAEKIKGISIDTTGSTPVAVDEQGTPLSLKPGFEDNPNAMFVLWKDHTAIKEADQINDLAKNWGGEDYTKYEGGIYSSEWFWAKILYILRQDEKVREAAFSWVEHCDWLPALLCGDTNPLTLKRSRCAAGHKAMWHKSFEGLPAEEFLIKLDPLLKDLRERLYKDTYTCEVKAGTLCLEWAKKLGLNANVVVGVGGFDAHLGAVGVEIKPYVLTKVMGTSTCDMLIAPTSEMGDKLINGICGQVDGSIIPGMLGMEAGQSAFGDVYAWFVDLLSWPMEISGLTGNTKNQIFARLTEEAQKLSIEETGVLALDWLNGRRTPKANQNLKAAITNLNLGTTPPMIFKALVEATAFGAKKIVDCFQSQGVDIKEVIALGGVAKKSAFVMQTVADVLNMDIEVARCEQACALGSAMCAAVSAGIYGTVAEAQQAMGNGFETKYSPIPENAQKYKVLYERYSNLGEFVEKETVK